MWQLRAVCICTACKAAGRCCHISRISPVLSFSVRPPRLKDRLYLFPDLVEEGIAACEMAFDCADLAAAGISVDSVHGINGRTPEETMRNIGLIASPGMEQTEKTIVEIKQSKGQRKIRSGSLFQKSR